MAEDVDLVQLKKLAVLARQEGISEVHFFRGSLTCVKFHPTGEVLGLDKLLALEGEDEEDRMFEGITDRAADVFLKGAKHEE